MITHMRKIGMLIIIIKLIIVSSTDLFVDN